MKPPTNVEIYRSVERTEKSVNTLHDKLDKQVD